MKWINTLHNCTFLQDEI